MIRLLLMFVLPALLPIGLYILWRAIAPPKFGGSRAIAREEWEPLPWAWLILAGGLMVMITVFTVIAYPELIIF